MQREEDLSAASGTLVDENETRSWSHSSCSKHSDTDDNHESCWVEEKVQTGAVLANPVPMQRREHRSCSNTRRLLPTGVRSSAKSHSRTRHALAKYKPAPPLHHLRKHAEPAELSCAPFDVFTAGIKELLHALSQGHVTSVKILETYLRQIDLHNDTLRAIVHLAPREHLYRLARQRDLERTLGKSKGALHGIPILVK
jgi:hypothetical protein